MTSAAHSTTQHPPLATRDEQDEYGLCQPRRNAARCLRLLDAAEETQDCQTHRYYYYYYLKKTQKSGCVWTRPPAGGSSLVEADLLRPLEVPSPCTRVEEDADTFPGRDGGATSQKQLINLEFILFVYHRKQKSKKKEEKKNKSRTITHTFLLRQTS